MRFQCENCQKVVEIDDSELGQPVGCGDCGKITTVPETPFSARAVINDFLIQRTLGSGGMGTVYLARQMSLDRPVALKILMEQFSRNSEFIVDFVREARAAARLTHPNIVQSIAVGEEQGIYFFAMEYVEGTTLKDILTEQTSVPWKQALGIIQQIAGALEFAWNNQQLVHRDIKPDNIMITTRGVAKLADLGLARAARETSDDDDEVMGTPQYICPEQLLGQPMDVRGDIYSLGATFYHAITGHFPFAGDSAAEIARKHLNDPVPDPREFDSSIPPELSYIISKMMAKKLEDRYEDAEELVIDTGLVLRGQQPAGFATTGARKKAGTGKHGAKPGTLKGARDKLKKQTFKGDRKKDSSQVSGRRGTGSFRAVQAPPEAVAPPTPAPSPSATAEKKSMKIKTTGSRRIKSASGRPGARAPASRGSAEGTYRRPGAAPAKSNKAAIFLLLIIISILGGVLGSAGWYYVRLNFSTPEQAQRYYLDKVAALTDEKDAYQNIELHFKHPPKSLEKSKELLDMANAFLADYPDSLFSLPAPTDKEPARTIHYVKVYKVRVLPLFGQNIYKTADAWAGIMLDKRNDLFREIYQCRLREERHKLEEAQIKENEAEWKFKTTKEQTLSDLSEYVDQMAEEYRNKTEQLSGIVSANEALLEEEKTRIRNNVMERTFKLDFPAVLELVNKARKNKSSYKELVSRRIDGFTEHSPLEKAMPQLQQFNRRFINLIRSVELAELKRIFEQDAEERQLYAALRTLLDLKVKEKRLFETRDEWFGSHHAALEKAKQYNDLVANTGKKFKGTKIQKTLQKAHFELKMVRQKPGDQKKIAAILRYEVQVVVSRYNRDGNIETVGTEGIPLGDIIRYGIFWELARKGWDEDNMNELKLLRGCHEFYFRPPMGKNILEKLGDDESAKFLLEEVEFVLTGWTSKYLESMRAKIRRSKSHRERKWLYKQIRRMVGDSEAFKEQEGTITKEVSRKK